MFARTSWCFHYCSGRKTEFANICVCGNPSPPLKAVRHKSVQLFTNSSREYAHFLLLFTYTSPSQRTFVPYTVHSVHSAALRWNCTLIFCDGALYIFIKFKDLYNTNVMIAFVSLIFWITYKYNFSILTEFVIQPPDQIYGSQHWIDSIMNFHFQFISLKFSILIFKRKKPRKLIIKCWKFFEIVVQGSVRYFQVWNILNGSKRVVIT